MSNKSYRAFTGDDKGQIKSILCELPRHGTQDQVRISATTISRQSEGDQDALPIHKLRCYRNPNSDVGILAAACADGQITTYSYICGSNELKELSNWKEGRMKDPDCFVGLQALPSKGWLTCTQQGRLRLSAALGDPSNSDPSNNVIASLPMRLNDMRLSPSCSSLAYGGNEVDLSLWDVERTFSEKPSNLGEPNGNTGKKRKKGKGELMYAEVWRAKQLPNDSLSLRQSVHITSLSFIQGSGPTSQQPSFHIVTGNKSGALRRFDTRVARRPVANWENIAKVGGIRVVESGRNEHELFVSDNGSNLSAIDVRNGKVCYSYKGLPSAAASFTPISKSHLASVSLDRIFRLHSVFSPPAQSNAQQLKKGELIGQEFLKSTPIAVVWDEFEAEAAVNGDPEDGDEDIWEGMEVHGEDGNSTDGSKESDHEQKQSKAKKRMRK